MSNSAVVKLVAVGDTNVGKTSLLMRYVNNEFPTQYVPTVFDNYDTNFKHNDTLVRLSLWDTSGQEEYEKLRYLCYPNTSMFLLIFNLTNLDSFNNICDKWLPEICERAPNTPFLLVGDKSDLKEKNREVSVNDAVKFAGKYNMSYIECSAKSGENVEKIFEHCINYCLQSGNNGVGDNKSCFLM